MRGTVLHLASVAQHATHMALTSERRYLGAWLRSHGQRALVDHGTPWLAYAAIDRIRQHLQPGMRVFEWGGGGSTLFFAEAGAIITCVEHDAAWAEILSQRLGDRATVQHVPAEPSAQALDPANPAHYASSHGDYAGRQFYRYATAIRDFPDASFDIIVIDGRARNACLLEAVPKVRADGLIVVDDADRPHYTAGVDLSAFDAHLYAGSAPRTIGQAYTLCLRHRTTTPPSRSHSPQ